MVVQRLSFSEALVGSRRVAFEQGLLIFLSRSVCLTIYSPLLYQLFKTLRSYTFPFWIVIFAEGTRFTSAKHAESVKFVKEHPEKKLPILDHLLLPRPKGLPITYFFTWSDRIACPDRIQPCSDGSSVECRRCVRRDLCVSQGP